MDMFIGFLAYTNEAVIVPQKETADISMLDETVLNALDIDKEEGELTSLAGEGPQPPVILSRAIGRGAEDQAHFVQ